MNECLRLLKNMEITLHFIRTEISADSEAEEASRPSKSFSLKVLRLHLFETPDFVPKFAFIQTEPLEPHLSFFEGVDSFRVDGIIKINGKPFWVIDVCSPYNKGWDPEFLEKMKDICVVTFQVNSEFGKLNVPIDYAAEGQNPFTKEEILSIQEGFYLLPDLVRKRLQPFVEGQQLDSPETPTPSPDPAPHTE